MIGIAGDPGCASSASGNNSDDSDGSEDETVAEDDDNADVAVVDPDGFQEVSCNDMADNVPWRKLHD